MVAYESDLYAWALEQAALVEKLSVPGLDSLHVADELRDVAKGCRRDLYDALVMLGRLLCRGHSPDTSGVQRCLRESPSLQGELPLLIGEAARDAYHLETPAQLTQEALSSRLLSVCR